MSLEKDHLQKAFTGLTEKSHPIKDSYISRNHQCVWSYGPPSQLTSNIRNVWFTGGGKGRTLLLSSSTPCCTTAELQVDPEESCQWALPPPQASLTPQHARREWGGEIIKNLAITAFLSGSGAIKLQGGFIVEHSICIHSPAVSQVIWWGLERRIRNPTTHEIEELQHSATASSCPVLKTMTLHR